MSCNFSANLPSYLRSYPWDRENGATCEIKMTRGETTSREKRLVGTKGLVGKRTRGKHLRGRETTRIVTKGAKRHS